MFLQFKIKKITAVFQILRGIFKRLSIFVYVRQCWLSNVLLSKGNNIYITIVYTYWRFCTFMSLFTVTRITKRLITQKLVFLYTFDWSTCIKLYLILYILKSINICSKYRVSTKSWRKLHDKALFSYKCHAGTLYSYFHSISNCPLMYDIYKRKAYTPFKTLNRYLRYMRYRIRMQTKIVNFFHHMRAYTYMYFDWKIFNNNNKYNNKCICLNRSITNSQEYKGTLRDSCDNPSCRHVRLFNIEGKQDIWIKRTHFRLKLQSPKWRGQILPKILKKKRLI